MHILLGSGNKCVASDRLRLDVLGCAGDVTTGESEDSVDGVESPIDVILLGKLGILGIVGTGGRLPWAIFSTNFSADFTAVGLLLLRIQFYIVCVTVCV